MGAVNFVKLSISNLKYKRGLVGLLKPLHRKAVIQAAKKKLSVIRKLFFK
jgi:hypothetical protein